MLRRWALRFRSNSSVNKRSHFEKTTHLTYPDARRDDTVVDEYHGVQVPDPYRWLEDPDSEETKAYIDAQNAVTFPYLESFPSRQKLKKRITECWDVPRYSCPYKRASRIFYTMNTGLQNQSVMYMQEELDGEAKVLFDPNALSADGTFSLSTFSFSEDGRFFAYGLSECGSDWIKIKIRDVTTLEDLPEELVRIKYLIKISWTHDHKGFFYSKFPVNPRSLDRGEETKNKHHEMFYHRIGTPQEEDVLCIEFPDNVTYYIDVVVSDCGRYLVVTVENGGYENLLYFCDLSQLPNGIEGKLPLTCVVDVGEADYQYVTNEGSICTLRTNKESPNYRLINIDFNNPAREFWVDLIPEDPNRSLQWATCVHGNKLVVCYVQDLKCNVLQLHRLDTGEKIGSFPLDVGTISGFSGKKKDSMIFYLFESFLTPGIVYHCDLMNDQLTPKIFIEIVVKDFDTKQFVTEQVFYPSKNGVKIPMFLIHSKDMVRDGNNPTLLKGYGHFHICTRPEFTVSHIVFMQSLGGVIAIANNRGFGEYDVHRFEGIVLGDKQNVFDDFQCAAKYLIKKKYTCPKRIAIQGESHGGLLVGACINQCPDLFGCAIAQVGVMDMLRFQWFTSGHSWIYEFGVSEHEKMFPLLYKYSPLHNVRVPEGDIQYPAVLLLTADHDDRVVPLHSLKFIAELQHKLGECPKQTNPLMIRVDTNTGHGAGKPIAKVIEEQVDICSFIANTLHIEYKSD